MAKVESHFSFSTILAFLYAASGILLFNFHPEIIFLASVVLVIAGILPNIDEGSGEPAKEFAGLIAAVSPLLIIQFFPTLEKAGISRIILVVICSYLLSRIIISKILENLTTHRGMLHSIPAAILTFEIVYLLFWDLTKQQRFFIAFAAFAGFLSHLLMDAYGNLDITSRVMGKGVTKKPAALKLWGQATSSNIVMYSAVVGLGWFVLKDFYPGLKLISGIQ